jgi:phosphatidylcholine synthase
MVLATVIDATDGTLARAVGVKTVLPGFDGRRLDDITDFLTYTFLPLLLVWRAGVLPHGWEGWLVLPLLASAYGFCQVSIKTDDGYFLGFPSLWNVVAFYVYALRFDGWVSLGLMVVLGVLTFVPSKYLYPSQPGRLNRWSTILGAVWGAMLLFLVWQMPSLRPGGDAMVWAIGWASLLYPIYYFAASWAVTLRSWRGRRASLG